MNKKLTSNDRPIAIDYVYTSDLNWYQRNSDSVCSLSLKNAWKRINTTAGSIDLKERPEKSASGTAFITELTARHPGHETESPADISQLSGRRVILKITYRSGLEKIIGNGVSGPRIFISSLSSVSTNLSIEAVWQSDWPNLWNAPSVDSNPGSGL